MSFEQYDMPGMDENGIFTGGGAKAAWFKDTEGNIMALIQNISISICSPGLIILRERSCQRLVAGFLGCGR